MFVQPVECRLSLGVVHWLRPPSSRRSGSHSRSTGKLHQLEGNHFLGSKFETRVHQIHAKVHDKAPKFDCQCMVLVRIWSRLRARKATHQNIKKQRRKEDIWPYSPLVSWTIWKKWNLFSSKCLRSPPDALLSDLLLCPQKVETSPSPATILDGWYLVVFQFIFSISTLPPTGWSLKHCKVTFVLWSNGILGKSFVWGLAFINWPQASP